MSWKSLKGFLTVKMQRNSNKIVKPLNWNGGRKTDIVTFKKPLEIYKDSKFCFSSDKLKIHFFFHPQIKKRIFQVNITKAIINWKWRNFQWLFKIFHSKMEFRKDETREDIWQTRETPKIFKIFWQNNWLIYLCAPSFCFVIERVEIFFLKYFEHLQQD